MNTRLLKQISVGLLLLPVSSLWAQVDSKSSQSALEVLDPGSTDDQMKVPPPVSGRSYPTEGSSQERSNYLRGGVTFTSAYTDNALGSVSGQPVSDVSYSVAPFIELDESTPRL